MLCCEAGACLCVLEGSGVAEGTGIPAKREKKNSINSYDDKPESTSETPPEQGLHLVGVLKSPTKRPFLSLVVVGVCRIAL